MSHSIPDHEPGKREVQQQLDFTGKLRQLEWLREFLTEDTHVKHLLRVLWDHTAGGETDCWLTKETIAREMSTSVSTVDRTVREAKRQQLVIVFGPEKGRSCNTYRLRKAEIREQAAFEKQVRLLWRQANDETKHRFKTFKNYLDYFEAEDIDPFRLTGSPRQPDGPTPSNRQGHPVNLTDRNTPETTIETSPKPHPADGWGWIEEMLKNEGVNHRQKIIKELRERGCSSDYVAKFIDYGRKAAPDGTRAWGAGAIYRRLENLRPGQEIESGWLDPCEEYETACKADREKSVSSVIEMAPAEIRDLVEWVLSRELSDEQRRFWEALRDDEDFHRPGFARKHPKPLEAALKKRNEVEAAQAQEVRNSK